MTNCKPALGPEAEDDRAGHRRRLAAIAASTFVLHAGTAGAQAGDPGGPDLGAMHLAAMELAAKDPSAKDQAATNHSAMDHAAMGHGMAMPMTSAFGPYPMTREGSGTSWVPEATPMGGVHASSGGWTLMAHGFANLVHDRQSGPRGDTKTFTQSMGMAMAQRPLGPGTFGARAMLSLDPTQGRSGYPLLLQTGESADGREPLVDRQHPHDLFMELSSSYSVRLGDDGAAFVYLGLPGEPALGPPAFMHRFSGMRNPEAPLTHHWLDSTHITFGVATVGASRGPWQLEGSWFNGREPDERRWNIETRSFDSWSTRLSWNPTPAWSAQVSRGDLKSPEALEPATRVKRTTASVSWQGTLGRGPWQTTLAWGLNDKRRAEGTRRLPGWLLESTAAIGARDSVFARWEQVKNDELFHHGEPLAGDVVRVRKLSVGAVHDFATIGPARVGIGAVVGLLDTPRRLDAVYGRRPTSVLVFLQGRL